MFRQRERERERERDRELVGVLTEKNMEGNEVLIGRFGTGWGGFQMGWVFTAGSMEDP